MLISFICFVADDCLRDVYVIGKYRDIILPMTVIKILNSVFELKKAKALELADSEMFKDLESIELKK